MKIEATHKSVNDVYSANFNLIIKGFRENGDRDELSYDLEEVYEDDETLGALFDYLVENEKCEIWDLPYLTYLILNNPETVHAYFE